MFDQGGDMDIRIDKTVVEFTPESDKETKQLARKTWLALP